MKNLLKTILPTTSKHPKPRGIYAVHSGEYQGGFMCYIEEESSGDTLAFMVMSPTEAIYITRNELNDGVKGKTIDLVEQLPVPVYEVILANYKYERRKDGDEKPNN